MMMKRSLIQVVTTAWLLTTVNGQLSRRQRRVRVAAEDSNALQLSFFDIEAEVSLWQWSWRMIFRMLWLLMRCLFELDSWKHFGVVRSSSTPCRRFRFRFRLRQIALNPRHHQYPWHRRISMKFQTIHPLHPNQMEYQQGKGKVLDPFQWKRLLRHLAFRCQKGKTEWWKVKIKARVE